jgi:hypothetical protein
MRHPHVRRLAVLALAAVQTGRDVRPLHVALVARTRYRAVLHGVSVARDLAAQGLVLVGYAVLALLALAMYLLAAALLKAERKGKARRVVKPRTAPAPQYHRISLPVVDAPTSCPPRAVAAEPAPAPTPSMSWTTGGGEGGQSATDHPDCWREEDELARWADDGGAVPAEEDAVPALAQAAADPEPKATASPQSNLYVASPRKDSRRKGVSYTHKPWNGKGLKEGQHFAVKQGRKYRKATADELPAEAA